MEGFQLKYEESNIVELKRTVNKELKAEIVAFLNSYLGGTIYVGVEDGGSLYKMTQKEKDLNESTILNWIRDEAIYPNCTDFVTTFYNEDDVLVIHIDPGNSKPYYLKEKGLKSSGVYIRYGRNKSQASPEEITRMIKETDRISEESLISKEQTLTFKVLQNKFDEKKMDFNDFNFITSGFIDRNTNLYTNLAYWISDQYQIDTKMAVYQGLDRDIFRSKKEYAGSIITQIDKVLEYFELCNEVRVVIDGSPMRKEVPSYDMRAARECILNCYCHRDYARNSNIKIEFFDDRCEILSPGGFYGGLTLEDALEGVQSFRNERLVKLLFKLGYIENYASGLTRVFNAYKMFGLKPNVYTSLSLFKITLPNINYDAFKKENDYGEINGKLNGKLNGEINDTIKLADLRDMRIYVLVQNNPGIKKKEIVKCLIHDFPGINENIVAKRIKIMESVIEFKGPKKTGGYYLRKSDTDQEEK